MKKLFLLMAISTALIAASCNQQCDCNKSNKRIAELDSSLKYSEGQLSELMKLNTTPMAHFDQFGVVYRDSVAHQDPDIANFKLYVAVLMPADSTLQTPTIVPASMNDPVIKITAQVTTSGVHVPHWEVVEVQVPNSYAVQDGRDGSVPDGQVSHDNELLTNCMVDFIIQGRDPQKGTYALKGSIIKPL